MENLLYENIKSIQNELEIKIQDYLENDQFEEMIIVPIDLTKLDDSFIEHYPKQKPFQREIGEFNLNP